MTHDADTLERLRSYLFVYETNLEKIKTTPAYFPEITHEGRAELIQELEDLIPLLKQATEND